MSQIVRPCTNSQKSHGFAVFDTHCFRFFIVWIEQTQIHEDGNGSCRIVQQGLLVGAIDHGPKSRMTL
jgi:hypothetical protein